MTPHDIPQLVAIGASAGGVGALRHVLGGLAPTFPCPIVVVQHLPADRPSLLQHVLGRACVLPVSEAQDKQALSPGHVYLAPPDYHMLIEDAGSLALSVDDPVLYSRPSIDVLFESAADVFGPGVLAILLTGASADGSAGLAAVRNAGGRAWVQDPAEAECSLMPSSALQIAGADAVLTLDQISQRLAVIR